MDIELQKQLLTLVFERSATWQSLWNFFYTVAAALIAVLFSGKLPGDSKGLRVALIALFVVFAMGNCGALNDLRLQRNHLIDSVLQDPGLKPFHSAAEFARPPDAVKFFGFHIALDVAIVLVIWLVPIASRKRSETKGS